MYKLIMFFLVAAAVSGCYTMPTEDNCSLIPSTNNPDMTKQRRESPLPQMPI